MAREVVELVTCDGCKKKGEKREATEELTLMGESWDLCEEHAQRFVEEFRKTFDTQASGNVQKIA